jgi:hypothetical protein
MPKVGNTVQPRHLECSGRLSREARLHESVGTGHDLARVSTLRSLGDPETTRRSVTAGN